MALDADECGVCGGDGIADGACDCDGNVLDECGVCGGAGIADGACDCAGNVLTSGVCAAGVDADADGICLTLTTSTFLTSVAFVAAMEALAPIHARQQDSLARTH